MAKSKSQKKRSKQQKQRGGEGASDYALKVYGNMNDQRPISASNNAIVMNTQRGGNGPGEGDESNNVIENAFQDDGPVPPIQESTRKYTPKHNDMGDLIKPGTSDTDKTGDNKKVSDTSDDNTIETGTPGYNTSDNDTSETDKTETDTSNDNTSEIGMPSDYKTDLDTNNTGMPSDYKKEPGKQGHNNLTAEEIARGNRPLKVHSNHDYPVIGGSKQSKQQLKKSITKKIKQIKKKGGSLLSFSEYASSPSNGSVAKFAVLTEGARTMQPTGAASAHRGGQAPPQDLQKVFMKAGSKLSKQQLQSLNQQLDKLQKQQQQGGVGLNEIVVPLILLYASQRIAKGKTAKKNMQSIRKTMRKSVKFSK